jgi:DnaJ-class molecular chaperone
VHDREERKVPLMDCPNCDGTGFTQDAAGEEVVCPMCEATGVLFDDEGDPDTDTE